MAEEHEQGEPTELDRANAANRADIAARQNAEWMEAYLLGLLHLGPGWQPWMKLTVCDSDFRNTGDRTPRATVFKLYKGELKLTENSLFVRRMDDGLVQHAKNYEELLPMLPEAHTTKTLEIKGQNVPAPRWVVHWSALEKYTPRTAEELASLRVSRERGKAERAEAKWQEENPLLVYLERQQEEEGRER
jgi:hypothetical protein